MRKKRFLNTVINVIFSVCLLSIIPNFTYAQKQDSITLKIKNDDYWEKVMKAISLTESGGKPDAVSKNGRYVGYLQISPVLVKECNKILGKQKFTLNDRKSVEKSKEMFKVIQSKHNPQKSIEKAIRLWNGGSNYSIKKTNNYYKRVMKIYNKL